jgi:hypothetical protein
VSDWSDPVDGSTSGMVTGDASLTATATIGAAAVVERITGSSLSGTASIATAGFVARVTGASLAATGSITTAGSVERITGASLTGTASITAAGLAARSSGANLTATATLGADGLLALASGASLSAAATLTAGGTTSSPSAVIVFPSTAGSSGQTPIDTDVSVSLTLTADDAITATGQVPFVDGVFEGLTLIADAPVGATGKATDAAMLIQARASAAGGAGSVPTAKASVRTSPITAGATGAAGDPAVLSVGSGTVVPATALGWGTAQGAQIDAVDGGPGGDNSPFAETAQAAGSAFSTRWRVTLRSP